MIEFVEDIISEVNQRNRKRFPKLNILQALSPSAPIKEPRISSLIATLFRHDTAILKSFIARFLPRFDLSLIEFPTIVCEHQYIDILICEEGKYALLIENKCNNAEFQLHQLGFYIDTMRTEGFPLEQICVLLLPQTLDYEDDVDEVWQGNECNYKSIFLGSERYIKVSYVEEFHSWLGSVLEQAEMDDWRLRYYVQNFLEYIDLTNPINTDLMKEAILEKLNLGDDLLANHKAIYNLFDDCRRVTNTLKELLHEENCRYLSACREALSKQYEIVDCNDSRNTAIGIPVTINDKPAVACLGFDNQFFIGVRQISDEERCPEIDEYVVDTIKTQRKGGYRGTTGSTYYYYEYPEIGTDHLSAFYDLLHILPL